MKTCANFDVYLHANNELHAWHLFWDIFKILQTCYFEYFENAWSCPSIMEVSRCRKLWWPKCWNQLGHVWLYIPKTILLPCRKLPFYLHAKNRFYCSLTCFLRYYILKDPAIQLANTILTQNWRADFVLYKYMLKWSCA